MTVGRSGLPENQGATFPEEITTLSTPVERSGLPEN